MSWFWIALAATLAWGGADLFYKLGANERDRYSHLKTSVFVGLCFGLHALYTLIFGDIGFDWRNLYLYLPVSSMYILSMTWFINVSTPLIILPIKKFFIEFKNPINFCFLIFIFFLIFW